MSYEDKVWLNEKAARIDVMRSMFTDPVVFDLEIERIFDRSWVYVCHESQIANPRDFLSVWIGNKPVVITRDGTGTLGGFVNVCGHRGAMVCREKKGNRGGFECPFHGWTYDTGGKLLRVRGENGAGYPAGFSKAAHDMTPLARVESYRGFVFASLSEEVCSIEDYLAGASFFIDLIVDQAADGLEVLAGSSTYTFNGNWKLQMENGADGYHVACVHSNYVSVLKQRETGESSSQIRALTPQGVGKRPGGFYAFKNGHVVLWSQREDPSATPNFPLWPELKKRFGEDRAFWMIGRSRNLGIYPNLFLMDSLSTQIRHFRPVRVDRTEVTGYCFAPVGEPPEIRSRRLRQYEDFYNASGMATPDDLAEFNSVQQGLSATPTGWNDISRGAVHWHSGPDDLAKRSGFHAELCGALVEDEGLFLIQHKSWRDRMFAPLSAT